jgi:hypothetical protein
MVDFLGTLPSLARQADRIQGRATPERAGTTGGGLCAANMADLRPVSLPPGGKVSAREFRNLAGQVSFLVQKFRFHCRHGSDSPQLTHILDLVIRASKDAFGLSPGERDADGQLGAEEVRCIDELEILLQALRAGRRPPAQELDHAMDSMIVACVKWDIAATDGLSFRSRS